MTFEPIASPSTQDPGDLVAKLGVNLVDSGAIDRRTLDRARRVATETGGRLDQVLTQLGLVSDRGLAEALAQLIAAPLVGAADYPDAPLFHDRLKPKFLRRVRAMPIAASDERATLAMADPLDIFTRNAIAAALGRSVAVAVAVPIELEAAFDRLYAELGEGGDAAEMLDDMIADAEPAEEDDRPVGGRERAGQQKNDIETPDTLGFGVPDSPPIPTISAGRARRYPAGRTSRRKP